MHDSSYGFSAPASLTHANTFRLNSRCWGLATPTTEAALWQALNSVPARHRGVVILGGGSNVLLPEYLDALVIQPKIGGIRCIAEQGTDRLIEVGAGVVWDELVRVSLAQGWFGLENLSLIPGSVGACPVQNIGAYGVEVAERIVRIRAVNRRANSSHQAWREFRPEECGFGYRESRFKPADNPWVISSVTFRLSTIPRLVLDYGDVREAAGPVPTPQSVSQAIRRIRSSKLPDPANIPNVGSFFKNPIVSAESAASLKARHPGLPCYPQRNGTVKLAAGWLIEQCGWKGKAIGPVAMYARQALVMVNTGQACLANVMQLTQAIQLSVKQRFGVMLEREPVMVSGPMV